MSDFLLHGVNMETLKTVSRTFRTADLRANLVQESPYRDNCEGHRLTLEAMDANSEVHGPSSGETAAHTSIP